MAQGDRSGPGCSWGEESGVTSRGETVLRAPGPRQEAEKIRGHPSPGGWRGGGCGAPGELGPPGTPDRQAGEGPGLPSPMTRALRRLQRSGLPHSSLGGPQGGRQAASPDWVTARGLQLRGGGGAATKCRAGLRVECRHPAAAQVSLDRRANSADVR